MMRKVSLLVIAILLISTISCNNEKKDTTLAKETMINALSSLYKGDVDTYMQNAYFGGEIDSTKKQVLRTVLKAYSKDISSKGGMKSISATNAVMKKDSVVCISCDLNFNDGTKEEHIENMVKVKGEWKIRVAIQ